MLRILSWSSGLGCDKVHPPDFDMFVPKDHAVPATGLPSPPLMKRKRSPSLEALPDTHAFSNSTTHQDCRSEALETPQTMRANASDSTQSQPLQQPSPTTTGVSDPDTDATDAMANGHMRPSATAHTTESRLQGLRTTINSQLSLEILLKHKELRFIDQEIAKCQVALEQLRRCSEIPYPSTQQPSVLVSQGKGCALRKLGERFPADSPPPWGVTDGPYSKHYAQWLLPDRKFDGGEPEPTLAQVAAQTPSSGRSTRGHYVDVLGGKPAKHRARGGALQALPVGYGQPKEKATGPMILKRKSDGAMVKLVCPDCGRHDFGSAQGFINHCRIGHSRSFASHDAAAEACGEAVEYNENGTIKGLEPVVATSTANVHALVRSAKLLPEPCSAPQSLANGYIPSLHKESGPTLPSAPVAGLSESVHTPHLSALLRGRGLGLNLSELVTDAKTTAGLPELDADDEEMDMDSPAPIGSSRHPMVAGSKQSVRSGVSKTTSQPLGGRTILSAHPSLSNLRDPTMGLLPSPTNESTQAPSLVDDDEEFDPQSPASCHEGEHDVDFEVHDDEVRDRVVSLGGHLAVPQSTCAPVPSTGSQQACKSSPTRRFESGVGNGPGQPAFASPSPAPEGSDRKRRKLDQK